MFCKYYVCVEYHNVTLYDYIHVKIVHANIMTVQEYFESIVTVSLLK